MALTATWNLTGPRSQYASEQARTPSLLETSLIFVALFASTQATGFLLLMAGTGGAYSAIVKLGLALIWPMIYLGFGFLFLVNREKLLPGLMQARLILVMPFVAFASVLWSVDKTATLYSSARLLMTFLIGFYIARMYGLEFLLRFLFFALLAAIVLSAVLILGGSGRHLAGYTGAFTHKNTLGAQSVMLVLTGLAIFSSRSSRALALVGIALGLILCLLSNAMTAILSLVAVAGVFIAARQAMRSKTGLIAWSVVALLSVFLIAVIAIQLFPYIDAAGIMGKLGRDITLTGRSYLWDAARTYIERRPLVGFGYDAFWSNAVDWHVFYIRPLVGQVTTFHNTYIEIMIQLGAIGSFIVGVVFVLYIGLAFRFLYQQPGPVALWIIASTLYFLISGAAEFVIPVPHHSSTLIFSAMFSGLLLSLNADRQLRDASASGTQNMSLAGLSRHLRSPLSR